MPTIATISQKGWAGKTTLAIHLAAAGKEAEQVAPDHQYQSAGYRQPVGCLARRSAA